MSLNASKFASQHMSNNIGFPKLGGGPGGANQTTTKKPSAKRLSAEQKAEQKALDDPYGAKTGGKSEQTGRQTRVVRKRVRRRRVSTAQAQPNYGTSKTQQTKQAKAQTKSQQAQQPQDTQQHMMRKFDSQSSLNRMTSQFQSGQANRPAGPQTPVGKKMAMLGNLQNYMQNDYAAMKANDQDTSFTYRTSEARQLVATLGTMVASTTNQSKKDDTKKSDDNKGLSPEAFGRQKGLLRSLKAMSDPTGPLPEGLPADYRPFESVA